MQCIVTYAAGMSSYVSKLSFEIQFFNFWYLSSEHYIYVSKDVGILGYFSKLKGFHEQNGSGNIVLER
jgi:hypothetical protein